MKSINTIQVTPQEDKEMSILKEELGLPSKREVLREGLKALRQILEAQQRRKRLQAASRAVRAGSHEANLEWAPLSSALKAR